MLGLTTDQCKAVLSSFAFFCLGQVLKPLIVLGTAACLQEMYIVGGVALSTAISPVSHEQNDKHHARANQDLASQVLELNRRHSEAHL